MLRLSVRLLRCRNPLFFFVDALAMETMVRKPSASRRWRTRWGRCSTLSPPSHGSASTTPGAEQPAASWSRRVRGPPAPVSAATEAACGVDRRRRSGGEVTDLACEDKERIKEEEDEKEFACGFRWFGHRAPCRSANWVNPSPESASWRIW